MRWKSSRSRSSSGATTGCGRWEPSSNVGTWMQRTGQDWIVLTQLTQKNAAAVGVVIALQFAPQVLLLPLTGFAADRLDRRKLLFATQGAMGLLALGLVSAVHFGKLRR
jgi:MFS family permease